MCFQNFFDLSNNNVLKLRYFEQMFNNIVWSKRCKIRLENERVTVVVPVRHGKLTRF